MNVNPVARFTFWLVVTLLAFVAFTEVAFAQDDEFRLGKPAVAGVSVCLTQEEAVAILITEKEKGKEEADAMFLASEKCANLPLEFMPHKVVATVRTARGLARVVEITSGEKTAYWLTYRDLGFKEV